MHVEILSSLVVIYETGISWFNMKKGLGMMITILITIP